MPNKGIRQSPDHVAKIRNREHTFVQINALGSLRVHEYRNGTLSQGSVNVWQSRRRTRSDGDEYVIRSSFPAVLYQSARLKCHSTV
jgi:hypothetical protein